MRKGTAGFTLVELIVVIAILGILAGIAIPVYSGYISKANEAADLQQLDAIKTAAVFAAVDADPTHSIDVKYIEVSAGAPATSVKAGAAESSAAVVDISDYYSSTIAFKSTTFADGAKWDGSTWSAK